MNRNTLKHLAFLVLIAGAVSGCDQSKKVKAWVNKQLDDAVSDVQAAVEAVKDEENAGQENAGQGIADSTAGTESDSVSVATDGDRAASIERMFVESIKVAQRVADGLADVSDEASATMAAPKIAPLIERRRFLANELAAIRIEMGEGEFGKVRQPYRDRYAQSNKSAIMAEAKLFMNPSLSIAWAKGLEPQTGSQGQTGSNTSAQEVDATVANVLRHDDLSIKLFDLITAARDEGDVSQYEGQIREILPEYQSTLRKMIADNVRLTRPQLEELKRRMKDHTAEGGKLYGEIKRILQGPMASEMRPILREIVKHQLEALPESTAKRKTKARWEEDGLL